MAGYGRDFMGRMRGMWNRFAGHPHEHMRHRPMGATGPGGEGYFLSRDMARDADYAMDYSDRGRDDGGGRGFAPGGFAQFGRAGAGRGYGGDFRTGRGGYDAGEFFVNRTHGGDTGYRGGYQRDLGLQRGMAAGGRGYGADYGRGGFAMGYDRGYRGGNPDRGPRYAGDYRDMRPGMRGGWEPQAGREHDGTGRSRTPFPRPYGR